MDVEATVTSKGQITIPQLVRVALSITEGDRVVFRVEGERAVLARTPALLELAGSIRVPPSKRGRSWEDARRATRVARARHVEGAE
jgi:AbrB family looped-hinge helix DNA binding protein